MKVAVECKSPLMQKSLELFLQNYISSSKHCDIIVRDVPCIENSKCFYISSSSDADLLKPFSKSQLIIALEKRYSGMEVNEEVQNPLDFAILQKRIESLTQEYQSNILKTVRAFYEK